MDMILPLVHQQVYKINQSIGLILSIVYAYEDYELWIGNNFLNIEIINNELKFKDENLEHLLPEIFDVNLVNLNDERSISDILVNILNDKKYIFIDTENSEYIPNQLICYGFNDEKRIFYCITYNTQGENQELIIPFNSINKLQYKQERILFTNTITSLELLENIDGFLDVELTIESINEYMNSINYKHDNYSKINDPYNYLYKCLENNESSLLNNLYRFYEHKFSIYLSMNKLCKIFTLQEESINIYNEYINLRDKIKLIYDYIVNLQNDYKKLNQYLNKIVNNLSNIQILEYEILKQYCKFLNENINIIEENF